MEPNGLERPVLAVDVVIFGLKNSQLRVLMPRRENEPFADAPSLPGVAVRIDETLEAAALRALAKKTGWTDENGALFIEQLAAFDAVYRDPRGRTISVAFMGIAGPKAAIHDLPVWVPVAEISSGTLPFDHNDILDTAVARLKGKLRYTNIAGAFLPETFRIEAIQEVYEQILEKPLNRSNFRNKLIKIGMIEQVTVLTEAVGKKGGRPPHLYRFCQHLIQFQERDFL